ncbi:MAG: acetyl-CoA carboxylase biotin carboxyl carrier protein [Hellea sp.]|nr:acetyl-CoA carboxylase biotin carboxyl carrier protein [Hellea sp.]
MAAKKPSAPSKSSETKLVRELAEILNETDLSEIEMKRGDLKIRVSKNNHQNVQSVAVAAPAPTAAPAAAPVTAAAPASGTAPIEDHSQNAGAVKSPMVGTAYIRPSPDASAFVSIGDSVSEGDTIMLVEAMKTFNPITAPKSGTVTAILVSDAQPVEFGEPLFIID